MHNWQISVLIGLGAISLVVIAIVSAKHKTRPWQQDASTTLHVDPTSLVNEAYSWYAASSQHEDGSYCEILQKIDYGIATLMFLKSRMPLDTIDHVHLPPEVDGPQGLLTLMKEVQSEMCQKIKSLGAETKNQQPHEPRRPLAEPTRQPKVDSNPFFHPL